MKRYVPIIIGIVALCAVLYVGNAIMDNRAGNVEEEEMEVSTTSYNGTVVRMFEGENTLEYSFDLPEGATTTVERDGALIKIKNENGPLAEMYISYEGGRGYTPADYIRSVIVPNVAKAIGSGTTTLGLYDWNVVGTDRSEWHVASAKDGNWLIVIENRKVDSDVVKSFIESISVK